MTVKDALGRQTQFKYDAAGRVIEISYQQESGTVSGGGASSGESVGGSTGATAVTSTNSSGLFLFLGVGGGVLLFGLTIWILWRSRARRLYELDSYDDRRTRSSSKYKDDDDRYDW